MGVAVGAYRFYRHQQLLKTRAHLMREAIRNHDFTFRLPVKGLFSGERALQEALNEMGHEINRLVAQNEVESWQKLTRVLTHEIMNATAPITSISQAYLNSPKIQGTPYEEGIRAIYTTSRGLSVFVDSYRKFAQLQEPSLHPLRLETSLQKVQALFPTLEWNIDLPSGLTLSLDENLFHQVLINLIKNAQEARATRLDVRWRDEELWISNNGALIPAEVAREIFIPFFTTKRSGSGIGLSLSKRLMVKQGRNLRLAETPVAGFPVSFVL
ncbi:two-component system sensor histidine kinase [gut metagenome]|uniref:Two-component system sensor histidine kinase n=1 Tax=gut metagenome TaxID=749906 RepID=J9D1W1_9ZZZZ